jgi:hypothetical protein
MYIYAVTMIYTSTEVENTRPVYSKFFHAESRAQEYLDQCLKEKFPKLEVKTQEELCHISNAIVEGLDDPDMNEKIRNGPWTEEDCVYYFYRSQRKAEIVRLCCAESYLFEVRKIEVE